MVRAVQPLLKQFEVDFERALDEADREFDAIVLAHSGGLAKDGCHRDKAAGERHWHKKGSRERGGPCVKAGGKSYQLDGNRQCARERIALARDEVDGWGVAWQRHAKALRACIIRSRPARK